jgi:adenosylhomocysteine nucleosidase
MTVVTFALPAESSAFVRSLEGRERNGFVVNGSIAGKEIIVLHTGVGPQKCEERLAEFLRGNKPSVIVSSGFCGGTSDELKPCDLVIAENFSDEGLTKDAREILDEVVIGKIFSADRVIDLAADRYAIGRERGAIAIDMETATIARLCADFAIPMLGLRVVSDSPAAPFPAPPEVLFDVETQRTKLTTLFGHLARNPKAVPQLADFAKRITLVKTKLADALCSLLRML